MNEIRSALFRLLAVSFAATACGSNSPSGPPQGVGGEDASTNAGSSGGTSGVNATSGSGSSNGSQTGSTGGSTSGSSSGGSADGGQTGSGSGSGSSGGSSGSDASSYVGSETPGTAQAGDITIDPSMTYQVVDGFGQADVWQGSSSTAMQTLLFDPVNGIGLNLLRIGIESASGTSVLMGNAGIADGQACVKYAGSDCKVWAAPWSPPASMKNNDDVNGGGSDDTLITADYDAWATLLAAFPAYYKQQSGVDLFAMSAQNEPDFNPSTYEACIYDNTQLVNFIDQLGPKLAALDPPVKVLAAEPDNWGNLWGGDGYGPAILADSAANSYVGPIATHDYGSTSAGTYARPAPPANNTHHVWETECTPGDTGPITIATMVYAAFTTGGVNGWHYWWTEALVPNVDSPPPQVYALGNFSKFVRPGYYRVDVTGAPTPSASAPLVVAFTNKSDGTVAIVVVNGGGAQQVSFFVAGTAWPASVTPYVTTTSSNLAGAAPITVTAGRFSASLAAQSVTTFVGHP
jgi:glucuronoarabinoxylan endo-1,4-beta-xylanase